MLGINTVLLIITAALLAVLHHLGIHFFLYWHFWWFDILMHFFGGAVVALGVFSLKDFVPVFPLRLLYFIPVISFVIMTALAWEVFELAIGIPIDETYAFDAALDLVMGLLGGIIGFKVGHTIRLL